MIDLSMQICTVHIEGTSKEMAPACVAPYVTCSLCVCICEEGVIHNVLKGSTK